MLCYIGISLTRFTWISHTSTFFCIFIKTSWNQSFSKTPLSTFLLEYGIWETKTLSKIYILIYLYSRPVIRLFETIRFYRLFRLRMHSIYGQIRRAFFIPLSSFSLAIFGPNRKKMIAVHSQRIDRSAFSKWRQPKEMTIRHFVHVVICHCFHAIGWILKFTSWTYCKRAGHPEIRLQFKTATSTTHTIPGSHLPRWDLVSCLGDYYLVLMIIMNTGLI